MLNLESGLKHVLQFLTSALVVSSRDRMGGWAVAKDTLDSLWATKISLSYKQTNPVAWVRERTIPTKWPPLVGEVSANVCGYRVLRGQRDGSLWLYSRISRPDKCLPSFPNSWAKGFWLSDSNLLGRTKRLLKSVFSNKEWKQMIIICTNHFRLQHLG
jgi:hypothetical protein